MFLQKIDPIMVERKHLNIQIQANLPHDTYHTKNALTYIKVGRRTLLSPYVCQLRAQDRGPNKRMCVSAHMLARTHKHAHFHPSTATAPYTQTHTRTYATHARIHSTHAHTYSTQTHMHARRRTRRSSSCGTTCVLSST